MGASTAASLAALRSAATNGRLGAGQGGAGSAEPALCPRIGGEETLVASLWGGVRWIRSKTCMAIGHWQLEMFDRMLLKGHLSALYRRDGVRCFLWSHEWR
jgi:hypothetical protein